MLLVKHGPGHDCDHRCCYFGPVQAEWRRTGINFAETSGQRRPDEDYGPRRRNGIHITSPGVDTSDKTVILPMFYKYYSITVVVNFI